MNKRKAMSVTGGSSPFWTQSFVVCGAAFLIGSVLGTIFSSGAEGSEALGDFLTGYFRALDAGTAAGDLASVFWWLSKYHLIVFLLGFSILGVVFIPLFVLLRGFSLSFSMAVLVRTLSADGAIAGTLLFGLSALLSVPIFFLLAIHAMSASIELTRSGLLLIAPAGYGIYSRRYFLRFVLALILLVLLAIGERALLCSGVLEFPIFL